MYNLPINFEFGRLYGDANFMSSSGQGQQLFANPLVASRLNGFIHEEVLWGDVKDDGLYGAGGNDTIHGGGGNDTAIFLYELAGQRVGMRDGVTVIKGFEGEDQIREVELFKFGGAAATSLASLQSSPFLEQLFVQAVANGPTDYRLGEIYDGPVAGLAYQLLGRETGETVLGTGRADFINTLGGVDAVDAGAGNDVIDGGTGSNFLTGGTGVDTFFLDGRGYTSSWSTITDWQPGETVAVFGYKPGISTMSWFEGAGAPGYTGVTMHADLDGIGGIETSVTWSGRTRADLPTPLALEGLLWFI